MQLSKISNIWTSWLTFSWTQIYALALSNVSEFLQHSEFLQVSLLCQNQ